MKYSITILIAVIFAFSTCNNIKPINNIKSDYSFTKWQVDSTGSKIRKSEYKKFDKEENLIKWIQYLDDEKSIVDSFAYSFQGGLKIEKKQFNTNGLFSITKFEYDSNNKVKATSEFDRANNLQSYTKHQFINSYEIVENYSINDGLYSIDSLLYNDKNKLVSETTYMTDGEWFQKHEYIYDSKGNLLIQRSQANPVFDGIGIVEYKYEYDNKNRPIKEFVRFPDNTQEFYIYEYLDK